MAVSNRRVARPSARRTPTNHLVLLATRHMAPVAVAFLLSVLLLSPGTSIGDPGDTPDSGSPPPASAALAVSVTETPDAVRLRISASGDVEPGSVEVRFTGRKVVVLARDSEGREIRSRSVRLPAPVVEDGASADYDADDALVMTLRKQAAAQTTTPPVDPEAAR